MLGAPEMLLPDGDSVRERADGLAQGGARVLVLAKAVLKDVDAGGPSAELDPSTAGLLTRLLG